MFKFVVIGLVAIWLLGRITGRKRRIIRDSTHLLQLILWAALIFTGFTTFTQVSWINESVVVKVVVSVVWVVVTYKAAEWITGLWSRRRK